MKVVTYEDWQKNPTPRMMWVWDNEEEEYVLRKVVCIFREKDLFNIVIAIENDDSDYALYKHCAEIEEPKTSRMTYQELAWWLLDGIMEGKHREWSYSFLNDVHSYFDYHISDSNKPVDDDIFIREDGGEWHEPLVEVEE